MMFFSRERCRTIWLRRVTWRRNACVSNPDLWQKAAGIKLRQYAGIDLVSFDLRCNKADLLGISNGDPADVRGDHFGYRSRIAGRLDNHNVALRKPRANSCSGSRRMMM